MNDFKRLNEIVAKNHSELNALYKNMDCELINQALEITGLPPSTSAKVALLRRIVDLKVDPLKNELNRLNLDKDRINSLLQEMYDFVRKFHETRHEQLIKTVEKENILDEFNMALLWAIHHIGVVLNEYQKAWQKEIIDEMGEWFDSKFASIQEAMSFIKEKNLFQTNPDKSPCDRSYGAVVRSEIYVKDGKEVDSEVEGAVKEDKFEFVTYGVKFKDQTKLLAQAFDESLHSLQKADTSGKNIFTINYLTALKEAFCEINSDEVIAKWQKAEEAWMMIQTPIQIGHPLEYYEDAYTHAVALEWDIRLQDSTKFDEALFKENIKNSFLSIYDEIRCGDSSMRDSVLANIDKTQLYICSPMIFYGAELNGLFSAQVVPNDEFVSAKCGKKIFAFLNYVYESAKSKPFTKLSKEIFSKNFLDYGREILFKKAEIWKKVYEISTIGHEFGHIWFIGSSSENAMNVGGEFKFIEEYKATSGGLVNFFLNEDEKLKMPVFYELIKRTVSLIAWQKVADVRAYYCEGLIHLSLLFESGVLDFRNERFRVDFSDTSYARFKALLLTNYKALANHYANEYDASDFLARFVVKQGDIYLPINERARDFVKHYHARFEAIGNEIDESDERKRWEE